MKNKIINGIIVFMILALNSSAQEFSIFVNVNQYYSFGKQNNNTSYPILWYSSEEDEGFLLGGFGVGVRYKTKFNEQLSLSSRGSFLRYRQYGGPVQLLDDNGNNLGTPNKKITEFGLAGHFTLNYRINDQFEVGSGLGLIWIVSSESEFDFPVRIDGQNESVFDNNHYKPFIFTIPVEATYNVKAIYLNLRYEIGLLNRFQGNIKPRENSSMLTFEIGVKFN